MACKYATTNSNIFLQNPLQQFMIDVSKLFYERYCYSEACTRPNIYGLKYVGEHLEKSSRAQAACAWYPPTDLTAFPHDL